MDNAVFEGAHSGKQFSIEKQLIITLYRLGSSGEGSTVAKIAIFFGVGDGGTIQNITNRVFEALLQHKNRYVNWPNNIERHEMIAATINELPNCIGYVDGTEITLAEKPSDDPEAYFSRKSIYSIKMQGICDRELRLRHLVIGYPGSVHDARIFNNCDLSKQPSKFFCGDEWIAGDSAYKLSSTVITPFRASHLSSQKCKDFNKLFRKYRIRIEHCFGLLKERFGSLKELRLNVNNAESIRKACEWILVCSILHNIAIESKDTFDLNIFQEESTVSDNVRSLNMLSTAEGEEKRKVIMQLMGI